MIYYRGLIFDSCNRVRSLKQAAAKGVLPGNKGGFGLLELLIALTILAIGMLGIMKLQMQSGFGNVSSRHNRAAVNLARSKMEELKRIEAWTVQPNAQTGLTVIADIDDTRPTNDLDDWSSPDFTDPGNPMNESQDPSDPQGKIFNRYWNVVHDHPIPGFKTIRIRVSWVTQGQAKYVDLETQIGQKDGVYFE